MTIFEVNSVPYGSTGHIMFQIADAIESAGGTAYTSTSYTKPRGEVFPERYYRIGGFLGKLEHIILAKLTGRHGCYSHYATYRLIRKMKQVKPDIIHLHNIHGWYLNWPMLFSYLKQTSVPTFWTLHDCWSFTGNCPHFTAARCGKWETGCFQCPQYRTYPGCFWDDSARQYVLKKRCFTGVPKMTLVTPSQWLADIVSQSFLKDYPVKVIHNGMDLSVFRPAPSNFRERHSISQNAYILLGVAFDWSERKGLDVFVKLSKRLDHAKYRIVLVGTNKKVDKQLPDTIISIHRTQNQRELAEIYTAADLFVNPTREENYPTVNMEAIACGTPVLTFRTGGSPEILDETCGSVVDCDDVDALEQEIVRICEERPYTEQACLRRAEAFDMKNRFKEYVKLYEATKT